MTLRESNNPNNEIAIMETLKTILPVDTQLAEYVPNGTGEDLIFIQQKYLMFKSLSQVAPLAVLISSGEQIHVRRGQSTFDGNLNIIVGYYRRWDNSEETIDDLWRDIGIDLERMKSNVQDNDSTSYQGENNTLSVAKIGMSPYEGQTQDYAGMTVAVRQMMIVYNLLPYR
jgi:hypothetical protein